MNLFDTPSVQKILIDLLLDTEGKTYNEFLPWFTEQPKPAAELLRTVLNQGLRPGASEDDLKRLARAAVVLLQLDQSEEHTWPLPQGGDIWPMLRQAPDPRLRSYLIHRLSRVGLIPETLIQQYRHEQDVGAKRALLLSLGDFTEFQLPARRPQLLVDELLRTYRDDPDRGLHTALDWLLRQCWGLGAEVQRVDRELAGQPPGAREWYVNGQVQTLVMFRHPENFLMGSADEEPARQSDEGLHHQRIPRSFALATKEVTVGQFQKFLNDNPGMASRWERSPQKYGKDEPIVGVTWFEAAQYCRWLSEQEGIPEEQRCYPPVAEIKEGMKMPADYLSRTGYRLPTEAEWEYACRAGAVTSRHYGIAEELLGDYAWYKENANRRARAVGSKKPNDYGLFDMYGNAWEWCQDLHVAYPADRGGPPIEDREDLRPITAMESRVLRGGAVTSGAEDVRSASRFGRQPQVRLPLAGLRIARTCQEGF
jgi:formylglycine-generating enzyme required for sulfatase activity